MHQREREPVTLFSHECRDVRESVSIEGWGTSSFGRGGFPSAAVGIVLSHTLERILRPDEVQQLTSF